MISCYYPALAKSVMAKQTSDGDPRCPAVIMVAGTSSGVGKTTLTCGIMAALSRRGLNVAPFKGSYLFFFVIDDYNFGIKESLDSYWLVI